MPFLHLESPILERYLLRVSYVVVVVVGTVFSARSDCSRRSCWCSRSCWYSPPSRIIGEEDLEEEDHEEGDREEGDHEK